MKYHMKHLTLKDTGYFRSTNRVIAQTESDINFRIFVNFSLLRYVYCDWGDLPPSGFALNDSALKLGTDRILAKYINPLNSELSIYIITEQDRSSTTVMFTDEYQHPILSIIVPYFPNRKENSK